MTREEQIAALIELEPGYQVDLFGILAVYRLEDGRYAVNHEPGRGAVGSETLHESPLVAATEFERLRKQLQLGYEFEVE